MAHNSEQTMTAGADLAHRPTIRTSPNSVGPWRLDRLVARGLYTEIHTARPADSAVTARPGYAVKRLAEAHESDAAIVALFRREAAAAVQVSHPHLISLLSARVSAAPYYLVMPWLEGDSLRALMAGGGKLCLPTMLCIIRQVAEALAALSAAGWIHGDVKPENIMVSPTGHATLIDLGFARRADLAGWAAELYLCGTLDYVAPEVITSSLEPDTRSDLYSLGVTLYELVSGRLPFRANDPAELARRRADDVPADIHRLHPDLPLDLVRLLRRLLAKQPLRRPQSALEVVQRLVRLEIETFAERRPFFAGLQPA